MTRTHYEISFELFVEREAIEIFNEANRAYFCREYELAWLLLDTLRAIADRESADVLLLGKYCPIEYARLRTIVHAAIVLRSLVYHALAVHRGF